MKNYAEEVVIPGGDITWEDVQTREDVTRTLFSTVVGSGGLAGNADLNPALCILRILQRYRGKTIRMVAFSSSQLHHPFTTATNFDTQGKNTLQFARRLDT